VAWCEGDYATARSLFEQALEIARGIGIKYSMAEALRSLGYVAHHEGDCSQAAALFRESLAGWPEPKDRQGVEGCLVGLGGVALAHQQPQEWARGQHC
jgi:tetratricopeptide (TPR) repeat protein